MTGTDDLINAPGRSWAVIRAWWPLVVPPLVAMFGLVLYLGRLETAVLSRLTSAEKQAQKHELQLERLDQRQDEADQRNAASAVLLDRIQHAIEKAEAKRQEDMREVTRRLDKIGQAVRR